MKENRCVHNDCKNVNYVFPQNYHLEREREKERERERGRETDRPTDRQRKKERASEGVSCVLE